MNYEKPGAKEEITLYYDYTFNEDLIKMYGLSKDFDDQAFFVASVIDNLLLEGNQIVSPTKIWHELGNHGSPKDTSTDEILNILRLGLATTVTAKIEQVYDAWGIEPEAEAITAKRNRNTGKKELELISPAIPVQIVNERYTASGRTTTTIIKILGHTPFHIVGYPLKHYTTWNKDVLRLYTGRRTKRYYTVLRYLLTEIGWMRNDKSKRSNKLLYETLYRRNGDKSTRDRQLTRNMMFKLLDEVFKPLGYIEGYTDDPDGKPGVILTHQKQKNITAKK